RPARGALGLAGAVAVPPDRFPCRAARAILAATGGGAMRVLVTGGAGYIGGGVVEELLASGHRAVVYDNLYKGHRDAVHPAAEFVHADLLDAKALHAAISGADAVVHLAAHSLVGESVQEPAKYYRNNVVAGLALADAMREHGVRWLVFSSTAAVYGESAKQPIEETDPTAPTNPYGETKLAFENALRWYSAAYGLRSISLRYFNASGARTCSRCRRWRTATRAVRTTSAVEGAVTP